MDLVYLAPDSSQFDSDIFLVRLAINRINIQNLLHVFAPVLKNSERYFALFFSKITANILLKTINIRTLLRRQPSCLTCARLLHSILFQRLIRCDYEMDYPRASRSSARGSQARGTRLGILYGACAKFSARSLGRGSEIQYGGV